MRRLILVFLLFVLPFHVALATMTEMQHAGPSTPEKQASLNHVDGKKAIHSPSHVDLDHDGDYFDLMHSVVVFASSIVEPTIPVPAFVHHIVFHRISTLPSRPERPQWSVRS